MLQVILIFGTSITEREFVESSLRPVGLDLNLDRKKTSHCDDKVMMNCDSKI